MFLLSLRLFLVFAGTNFELTALAISAKVTNAPRVNAEFIVDCIGYRSWFPELVIGDECERGKLDLPEMVWHGDGDACGSVYFIMGHGKSVCFPPKP